MTEGINAVVSVFRSQTFVTKRCKMSTVNLLLVLAKFWLHSVLIICCHFLKSPLRNCEASQNSDLSLDLLIHLDLRGRTGSTSAASL